MTLLTLILACTPTTTGTAPETTEPPLWWEDRFEWVLRLDQSGAERAWNDVVRLHPGVYSDLPAELPQMVRMVDANSGCFCVGTSRMGWMGGQGQSSVTTWSGCRELAEHGGDWWLGQRPPFETTTALIPMRCEARSSPTE